MSGSAHNSGTGRVPAFADVTGRGSCPCGFEWSAAGRTGRRPGMIPSESSSGSDGRRGAVSRDV
uniref:Uncharacterized protein n=1 Tax=uncultured Nocardioidaceae bacterium TaxID=253824 RepID=A0A6J4L6P1_9ACTN|nr:MAG: hypothetical protein AVDCRST_MAG46-1046 [uncultured Nocardioidaceae bacterium]